MDNMGRETKKTTSIVSKISWEAKNQNWGQKTEPKLVKNDLCLVGNDQNVTVQTKTDISLISK
jgi:hypothetical protein